MSTTPRDELGDLLEVHRPMPAGTGWVAALLVPAGLGLAAGLGPPGPFVGALLFLVMAATLGLALASYTLVEHRIHEHGIVFTHQVPGFGHCVVPYYSCDPGSLAVIGRTVRGHGGGLTDISWRFRVSGSTSHNVLLTGLTPRIARRIGSGKAGWEAGRRDVGVRFDDDGSVEVLDDTALAEQETWIFSSRTPEHHVTMLRDLIAADQAATDHHPGG